MMCAWRVGVKEIKVLWSSTSSSSIYLFYPSGVCERTIVFVFFQDFNGRALIGPGENLYYCGST